MSNTPQDTKVRSALGRMYSEAEAQLPALRETEAELAKLSSVSSQELADAYGELYLPVSPEAGRLLYLLVRAARPTTVVEFGMSFGISTIHLAAAVHDNGIGRVITTELSSRMISSARKTFTEIGLDDLIIVLEGDALATLESLDGSVDFVLLDGWKDLYLPVIKLLEPQWSSGALIIADDTDLHPAQSYLDYVCDPRNGYVSVSFVAHHPYSMEISCRTT